MFTRVCHGGRWVNTGYLGSVRPALGVFRVRLVALGSALGAFGPCASLGSSEVFGFTGVCHGVRLVYAGSLGSCECALLGVEFMRARRVHPGWHSGTP